MLKKTKLAQNLLLMIVEDAEVGTVGGIGDHEDQTIERLLLRSQNSNRAIGYLMPNAKQAFIQLSQAFTKAPILQHFDPECHIWIETNVLGYAIDGVLSQIILDNLGQ